MFPSYIDSNDSVFPFFRLSHLQLCFCCRCFRNLRRKSLVVDRKTSRKFIEIVKENTNSFISFYLNWFCFIELLLLTFITANLLVYTYSHLKKIKSEIQKNSIRYKEATNRPQKNEREWQELRRTSIFLMFGIKFNRKILVYEFVMCI